MSLLTDVQTAAATFLAKVAVLVTQTGYLFAVITGPATGSTSLVDVGVRTLRTLARVLYEIQLTHTFVATGVYDPVVTYAAGDAVSLDDISYVSIIDGNLGNDPPSHPVDWMVLAVAPTIIFSITSFGALGDDSTDNTVMIQTAMDTGAAEVYVPDGIFRCSQITLPSTLRKFWGPGSLRAIGSITAFSPWLNSTSPNALGGVVEGLTFLADASFDTNPILGFVLPTNWRVKDNIFDGGRFSIQIYGGSNRCTVSGNEMSNYEQSAVAAFAGPHNTLRILDNDATHSGSAGHSIFIGDSADATTNINNDCLIQGNSVFGGPGFGIHVHFMDRGIIANNIVRETHLEAITAHGKRVMIEGNQAYWQTLGVDAGMSTQGDSSDPARIAQYITFRNNIVGRAAGCGVLIAQDCWDCVVDGNHITDCNRVNSPDIDRDGVHLAASLRATVVNNVISNVDGGHMLYGVGENPSADYSYIANNYMRGMQTGITSITGAHSIAAANNISLPN